MSAHTPGPWVVRDRGTDAAPRRVVECGSYSDEDPGVCGDHSKAWPLSQGDADLISAAPEMLLALKLARFVGCEKSGRAVGTCFKNGLRTHARYAAHRACPSCIAYAAIAKAEGR